MFNKLKQIKDLRDKAKTMQSEMSQIVVEGSADWGKVKVTVDGNLKIQKLTLDDEIVGNKAKLESAIPEAIADAMKKAQKEMMEKMKNSGQLDSLLGGLKE